MLRAAHVLVLVGALSIVAMGLLGGSVGLLTSFFVPGAEQLVMATFSLSFLSLAAGLGSILAWQALQALQGRASPPFHPQRIGLLGVLVLVLIILVGHVVLDQGMLALLAFPPLHVAAAVLPPLIVVALVGRALGKVTRRRDMVLQLSSGAFLSTSLAFTLELLAILGLLFSALVVVIALPGGPERIQDFATRLQDPTWFQDPENWLPLIRSPFILVPAFLVFAVLVPVIEEAVKTVGVGLMGYRRPTLAQAFLWGLAGGAGFALAEALFNTVAGLDAWASIISLRIGATLLHCFTGAMMGLAWHAILDGRRWGRAFGLYAASVGIHSLWNAAAAAMALSTLGPSEAGSGTADQWGGDAGSVALLLLILILATVAASGLTGLTWYVRERSQASDGLGGEPGALSIEAAPPADTPAETP